MRSTLRAARIRQAQVYRRLLRQVLRGIKPPAAFGGGLFIREALDLGLPETALSSGIKNSGRPLDSGWVVQRQVGEECGAGHGRPPDDAEDHFVPVWRNNDP